MKTIVRGGLKIRAPFEKGRAKWVFHAPEIITQHGYWEFKTRECHFKKAIKLLRIQLDHINSERDRLLDLYIDSERGRLLDLSNIEFIASKVREEES
jgi:hypothetical protein